MALISAILFVSARFADEREAQKHQPRLQAILENANRTFKEYLELFPRACRICGYRKFTFGYQEYPPPPQSWRTCARCRRGGFESGVSYAGRRTDSYPKDMTDEALSEYFTEEQRKRAKSPPDWEGSLQRYK